MKVLGRRVASDPTTLPNFRLCRWEFHGTSQTLKLILYNADCIYSALVASSGGGSLGNPRIGLLKSK